MSDEESTTVVTNLNEGSVSDTITEPVMTPEKDRMLKTDVPFHAKKNTIGANAGSPKPPKDKTERFTKKATEPVSEKPLRPEPEPVVPEYTPNYKFKVLDQEKEMDEWMRPLVKDKETEDKFRDMLTKAHGLSKIKEERDGLKDAFNQYRGTVAKQYEPVVKTYQHLTALAADARNTGEWGSFFQAAQIPPKAVIQWAANAVAHLEKDPTYFDQIKNQFQTTQNLQNLQAQNEALKQQMERVQMERQEVELNYTLSSPETQSFAQMFDTRVGKPGAFRQEIIRRGALIEMTEGRVASTQEIIGDLTKFYGGAPQAQQPDVIPAGTPVAEQGSEGKPVLPVIKSKPGSPAKKAVRSTDDLRNILQQRAAGG